MAEKNEKINGCGFHHLSMRVRDLEASLKFYTEGLGFVERFAWGQEPNRTVLLDTGDGNYFEISQGNPGQLDGAGHVRGPEVELGTITVKEGCMPSALLFCKDVDLRLELGMGRYGAGLRYNLAAL